jgi:transcriptional regulator with XRE-family HTH domain
MPLRQAFAHALRFARGRLGLSQLDIAKGIDASYVSRLESGKSSVTVDASERLAHVLGLHPATLLALTYAASENTTPRQLLRQIEDDLLSHGFIDEKIAPSEILHPVTAKGAQTTRAVLEMKRQGHSQAEVARVLGISTSTVGRHWNRDIS